MPARQDASRDFEPSGFAVLRTPLLPFDELVRWSDDLETEDDPDALARNRAVLRDRLRELIERREVREAIFVASSSLHDLIDTWIENPESERGRQCERALVRYLARMTGRSTPFGLFAGVSTATVADETNLMLENRSRYRRTTRVDAGFLVDVVGGLLDRPEFRESLTYTPNPSLYHCGERRRYVHSRPAAEEDRHLLVSVRESETLASTLAAASAGATPAELRAALAAAGHPEERARGYVGELIERQVLVPSVDLLVTGGDSTYGLGDVVPVLATVRERIARLDDDALGVEPARYRAIVSELQQLPAEVKPDRLFQVDMSKTSTAATLGRDVVTEILRGAELLRRIGYFGAPGTPLERFAERFTERYEGESVPLLEALDPDLGVAFDDDPASSPLVAGIAAHDGGRTSSSWGPRENHLLARLLELQAAGQEELVLGPRDLERLDSDDAPPLPDAFAVMASVAATSTAALAAGRFRVLVLGIDGPSGARLLGRFCHTDPRLRAAVEDHSHAEAALDPEAIFAEIVHLPRARDVNVVARPVLRDYEIVCLGGSGAAPERQIPLDDLLVSVEDGRVVLHSRRLGRRVVPRLTSAHNFSFRGMSVYRFLCALQSQGTIAGLSFWGPLGAASFLPRVRFGRILLSSARWRLDAEMLEGDDYRAVQAWRREHRVPRFVASVDFGGQLPVDLDNVLAVESLVHALRSRGSAEVVEFFPPPNELCVTGPEGAFAHELVVPFVRTVPVSARTPRASAPAKAVRRRFAPGSEWLYARLYTGETVADTVLTKTVAPLVRAALDRGLADRWFFLRYRDPEFHLRVRLHGHAAHLETLDDALVWRVELGSYQREVERYGGPDAIEPAEEAFHADSDAVLAILPLLEPGDTGQAERWRLGLVGVHRLLVDLGFDESERLTLMRRQRDAVARQLRWNATALGRVGARFREERAALERLLTVVPGDGHPLEPGLEILSQRSARMTPIAQTLRRLESEGRLTLPRTAIAGSLVHMHLNRLLRGDNTAQELVICDFLARLYEASVRRPAATAPGSRAP
jgi:thiopeptide-type bacteriocin biosynthesis protein